MSEVKRMYINGEWREASNGERIAVYNPANGEIIAYIPRGTDKDAEDAIHAAREAFDHGPWREMAPHDRAKLLFDVANVIEEHADELAAIETQNNGKTFREAQFDMSEAAKTFRYYAGFVTKPHGQTFEVAAPMSVQVVREPVGVCAQVVPWNYPLLMAAWKLAPALAAGNTIILKCSEVTPLTTIRLFELMEDLQFPKGVVNLLVGYGTEAGAALVSHPLVDKVAFTGGTVTGKSIMKAAADNLTNISLELGGKSPVIVFNDAELETAVDYAMFAVFNNSGQVCSAGSRLLLQEGIYDVFIEELVKRTKQISVGNGANENSEMGPLVSEQQLKRVLNYIEIGKSEGATLLCGGERLTGTGYETGYFVPPTIFGDVTPNMRIAQEEIFGPVLSVLRFKTEAEALEIANGTVYGLAAGVFTTDGARAMRVTRALRAGIVWINTYEQNFVEAPWGGYKQSGIGRELGAFGFEEYTELKQITTNTVVEPTGWFAKKEEVQR